MMPVMTNTAPRMACSHFQAGAVNALNSSATPAIRMTTPASTLTAATDVKSKRSTTQAIMNHTAAVIR
jgi:hypothetical protein